MPWKIVAASARGTSHAANGEVCQDAHAVHDGGSWFVGVVCDGAGSARLSDRGAKHGAEKVVARVAAYLQELPLERAQTAAIEASASRPSRSVEMPSTDADVELRTVVAAAIEEARTTLPALVSDDDVTLSDFNATLVGCVVWCGGGLFFHIGDGAAIALDAASLETRSISPAENGEFAEQTFFYTGDAWREHLRFTPVPAGADLIALMSDGAMTFAIASNRREVDRRFFAPVTNYLSRDEMTEEAGRAALHSTLSSPGACRVTHDDKTLLWARYCSDEAAARTPLETKTGRSEAVSVVQEHEQEKVDANENALSRGSDSSGLAEHDERRSFGGRSMPQESGD